MEFFVIFASLLAFSSVLEAQNNEAETEKSGPSADEDKRYEEYLLRRAKILDELDNLDKSIGQNVSKSAEKITYEPRPQNESNESSHHNDVPASASLDSEDAFAPAPPPPPSTYSRIRPSDHYDHYPPQYHYYSSSSSSSYSVYPPYPYPSSSSSYSSMYPSSPYSQYPQYCYGCYSGGYSGGYYPYQSSSWGGMPMGSNIFNMGLGWGLNMGIMGMPIGVGTGLGVNVG